MKNIDEYRKIIDEIDENIVELFIRRLETVQQISEHKKLHNIAVFDEKRENSILERMCEINDKRIDEKYIYEFFEVILNISKRSQIINGAEK